MVRLILFAALGFVVAILLLNGFYLRRDVEDAEDPFTIDVTAKDPDEEKNDREER